MIGLVGALQFLTRVPIRTRRAVPHEHIVPWFPFAGLVIGLVVGGVAAGLDEIVATSVAAACAVAAGLLVTGAFHEDGLADVADAFGGGWTREQRFEILKDSRHGTYGVAALTASIVIRVVAAGALETPSTLLAGLVVAHVLGRTAIVGALLAFRPASDSGLGADTARSMRRTTGVVGVVTGVAISAVAVGWWVLPLLIVTIAGAAATGWLAMRKIGGLAGDVLGATEQVVECLVLVAVGALATRTSLWWA